MLSLNWLVSLEHLSSLGYLLKVQATSLACTLKATKCTSLYLFTAENLHKSKNFCTFAVAKEFRTMARGKRVHQPLKKVRITAVRQTVYPDLMAQYENPIEHTCDVEEGQQWISVNGKRPDGMCPSAWESMREFVESLAKGDGNFYDGWMKNPMSAMISCNDGFRPFSFYIEVIK
jgi:uncharacterized repeat protein (TIGR04076 family)